MHRTGAPPALVIGNTVFASLPYYQGCWEASSSSSCCERGADRGCGCDWPADQGAGCCRGIAGRVAGGGVTSRIVRSSPTPARSAPRQCPRSADSGSAGRNFGQQPHGWRILADQVAERRPDFGADLPLAVGGQFLRRALIARWPNRGPTSEPLGPTVTVTAPSSEVTVAVASFTRSCASRAFACDSAGCGSRSIGAARFAEPFMKVSAE